MYHTRSVPLQFVAGFFVGSFEWFVRSFNCRVRSRFIDSLVFRSFVHSFISFIRPLHPWVVGSLSGLFVCSSSLFFHSFARSLVRSLVQSFIPSCVLNRSSEV